MSVHKTEKITVAVEKREVMGKKLKALRAEGKAPANIFGKDFTSTAISLNEHDFLKLFRKVGETQVLYLMPVSYTHLI